MIDTLKLSKRLREAQMPQAQAEALAEGLAESLKELYVTCDYLETQLARLRGALTGRPRRGP
jgi:hypothetical protein